MALLVLYYRLFQENTRGLNRELVIRSFMDYLALNVSSVTLDDTDDNALADESSAEDPSLDTPLFEEALDPSPPQDERALASRFLKRFIAAGWLGEETLADFSRVINITAWGRPFMKALADIDGGLKTEYESHIVTIHSLLCGETVKADGHHAVLRAREEARSLIDSLKVLSQSIKGFYDKLNAETIRSKAASVLHEHYNLYTGEVLDRAYKRLKTSDNVSRYRQNIFKQVSELLRDDEWLETSAGKYMRILQISREECREKLKVMLEEIRDDLRAVDPLEDEIDRRNAAYSRSSTEIIKAYIEPDSTVAGKIGALIKAIYGGNKKVHGALSHGMHRLSFLSPSSLVFRRRREEGDFTAPHSQADLEALDRREREFLEQMARRLSLSKINNWLDELGGEEKVLIPEELISDEDSYIRFVHALLYGDSRNNFAYRIEEDEMKEAASVKAVDYVVPDVKFRRQGEGESQ